MAYDGTNDYSQIDVTRPASTEEANVTPAAIQEIKRVAEAVMEKEHNSDGTHQAGIITTSYIADSAITTDLIADGAVTAAKLGAGIDGSTILSAGSVGTTELADGAVTSAKIATGAVGSTQLAASSVTPSKIGGGTLGTFLIGQSDGSFSLLALSGAISVNPTTGNVTIPASVSVPMAILQDLKSDGTDGGTFTSGSLVRRDLNSVNDPESIITGFSANMFSLGIGKYMIWAEAPAYVTGDHQAVLYDETSSAIVLSGGNSSNGNSSPATSKSTVTGLIDTTAASGNTQFSIKHQCSVTEATDGLGKHSSFTVAQEVYTQVMIIQIQAGA